MKCPECEAAGLSSRVVQIAKFVRIPSRPVAFYDETGEYHEHDLFSVRTPFKCSQGHAWNHDSWTNCPTCGVQVDPTGSDDFGRSA